MKQITLILAIIVFVSGMAFGQAHKFEFNQIKDSTGALGGMTWGKTSVTKADSSTGFTRTSGFFSGLGYDSCAFMLNFPDSVHITAIYLLRYANTTDTYYDTYTLTLPSTHSATTGLTMLVNGVSWVSLTGALKLKVVFEAGCHYSPYLPIEKFKAYIIGKN